MKYELTYYDIEDNNPTSVELEGCGSVEEAVEYVREYIDDIFVWEDPVEVDGAYGRIVTDSGDVVAWVSIDGYVWRVSTVPPHTDGDAVGEDRRLLIF